MTAVGLDVGTGSLKGIALADDGRVLAKAESSYPFRTPRPGWTEQDPELKPWDDRLSELASDLDDVDELLMELDPRHATDETTREAQIARGQLELFGTLLSGLADQKEETSSAHQIVARDGTKFAGSWDEIVLRMRDAVGDPTHTMQDFMRRAARRGFRETGVQIPTSDAESFIKGSADAGLLRIVR